MILLPEEKKINLYSYLPNFTLDISWQNEELVQGMHKVTYYQILCLPHQFFFLKGNRNQMLFFAAKAGIFRTKSIIQDRVSCENNERL